MQNVLNMNILLKILLSVLFVSFFYPATAQNKEKPTRYALEATAEFWRDTLLANPKINKNKKLVLDIKNLAKKRIDEADEENKIKTINEYVAIFRVDWETIDKQQKPKFKDKYAELHKNKNEIQSIISEDQIRKKLQDTALKEVENKPLKKPEQDTANKNNNNNNNKNNSGDSTSTGTPILLWVVLALAVLAPAAVYFILQNKSKKNAEEIAKSIVKKEVENVDKKYENKLKNTTVTQVSTSTDNKQIESEIQKIKFDLESIRNQITAQQSAQSNPNVKQKYNYTYYFGTPAIEEGYLHDRYKKNYDDNVCYVIYTDGKTGRIDIVQDNKSLIIKHQDRILKPSIAEKIGWKEFQDNIFSRSEPGEVELRGEKWVITEKVKVYFNE